MAADEPLNPPLKALGDSLEAEIKDRKTKKHPVDQVPSAPRTLLLSVQHVLAFYAGAVVVPLVVAGGLKLVYLWTCYLDSVDWFLAYRGAPADYSRRHHHGDFSDDCDRSRG